MWEAAAGGHVAEMSYGSMRGYRDSAASASGYGYSRYVDCNSALALLGFILFVDILRDIVEYVVTGTGRKKRWAAGGEGGQWAAGGGRWAAGRPEPDILTFISEGGADHLYHTLPQILPPLLEGWWEMSEPGQPRQCLQQGVCQANWVLAKHYGTAGRVFATLLSNVGSLAFAGEEGSLVEVALTAARTGRQGHVCEVAFPSCPTLNPSHTQPLYHNSSLPHTAHEPRHQTNEQELDMADITAQERLNPAGASNDL